MKQSEWNVWGRPSTKPFVLPTYAIKQGFKVPDNDVHISSYESIMTPNGIFKFPQFSWQSQRSFHPSPDNFGINAAVKECHPDLTGKKI